MNIVWTIIISILFFGALIFIHELGHFTTAKLTKVNVEEFSIGMGPALFKKRKGDTLYSVRAFPIGGFVNMEGEDGDGESQNAFNKKPLLARFLVLFAGAGMNFLTAFLASLILVILSANIASTTIYKFQENALSNTTGLMAGDEIIKIDHKKINVYTDIVMLLSESGGKPLDIAVKRNNEIVTVPNVQFPSVSEEGMTFSTPDFVPYAANKTVLFTVKYAFYQCVSLTQSVWHSLANIVTGKIGVSQLSGPVGTSKVIGEAAAAGFNSLLMLFIFISINLGIMNLLPFPALDGGRILMLLVEKLRGKPLNEKFEGTLNFVGFSLLMLLMLAVTFQDFFKLFTK